MGVASGAHGDDGDEVGDGRRGRRRGRGGGGGPDWQDLLKWSLSYNDGTGPPQRKLDDEERRWFYQAMESAFEDEGERLKQDMLILAQSHDGEVQGVTLERQCDIMEDVEDLVAQIDLAKTFVKMEGMALLMKIVRERGKGGDGGSDLSRLRAGALTAASTCINHNPEAQADFLRRGGIEAMAEVVVDKGEDVKVRAKALSVIAATVRHNNTAFLQFLHAAGLDIVVLALKDATATREDAQRSAVLLRKGFRLLEYVARETLQKFGKTVPQVRGVCLANAPALAASCAESDDVEVRESSLAFLAECMAHDPAAMADQVRATEGLVGSLRDKVALEGGDQAEERMDEIDLARRILEGLK